MVSTKELFCRIPPTKEHADRKFTLAAEFEKAAAGVFFFCLKKQKRKNTLVTQIVTFWLIRPTKKHTCTI